MPAREVGVRAVLWLLALTCISTHPAAAQLSVEPPPVPEIAIERRMAEALDLRPGDTVRLGPAPDSLRASGVVVAVYEPAADPAVLLNRALRLRMHLPDLERLLAAGDRIDRFGVSLVPSTDPDSAAAALNALAFGYRAYTSEAIAAESSQTFAVVSRFHRAIAVITIVASAVFLLCIMLLKVEERRLDAAVMRFVGVRRRTIFGALLLEAAVIAVLGSFVGAVLAFAASGATNAYYRRYFDTSLIFSYISPDVLLFSIALALALGLAAGALAAWRLVRTRPMVLWGRG